MDFCLEQKNNRFIKKSDSGFIFSLTFSCNFFYMYINKDELEFRPMDINVNPKFSNNLNKKISTNIENCLFEGIMCEKTFYITDILVFEGKSYNYNYFTRLIFIKKLLQESFSKKNCLELIKYYKSYSLEDIIDEVIPDMKIKPSFIYMNKNQEKYLMNVSLDIKREKIVKKNNIKKIIEDPEDYEKEFEIFRTNKSEIYLIKIESVFYIIRIPNMSVSKYIDKKFKEEEKVFMKCKYNHSFKKYEPII